MCVFECVVVWEMVVECGEIVVCYVCGEQVCGVGQYCVGECVVDQCDGVGVEFMCVVVVVFVVVGYCVVVFECLFVGCGNCVVYVV